MPSVTVYRNLDETQLLIMRGKDFTQVLNRLRKWMDKNNGEHSPSDPFEADGLTIFNANEGDGDITLAWCDCYHQWYIDHSNDPANPEYFDTWEEAREAFLESVSMFGEWRA